MHRGRDEASYGLFRQELYSVFTDLNKLMSSRLADVSVQVGAYISLFRTLIHKRLFHHTLTRFWSREKSLKFKGGIRKQSTQAVNTGFNLTSDWITKWREVFVSQ